MKKENCETTLELNWHNLHLIMVTCRRRNVMFLSHYFIVKSSNGETISVNDVCKRGTQL